MAKIILDFGSGNSCLNDKSIVKKMYDELKKVDTGKHTVICKWQLFLEAGNNIPLDRDVFDFAYEYGNELGYQVTSSVFDKDSLEFLLLYDVPMIKIANNRSLDWLIGKVPREIPVYKSISMPSELDIDSEDIDMLCVSGYPTTIDQYENNFPGLGVYIDCYNCGISDHTTNWDLFNKYKPEIIEIHYVLEHDTNNLDGGLFARTPAMLAEVL